MSSHTGDLPKGSFGNSCRQRRLLMAGYDLRSTHTPRWPSPPEQFWTLSLVESWKLNSVRQCPRFGRQMTFPYLLDGPTGNLPRLNWMPRGKELLVLSV